MTHQELLDRLAMAWIDMGGGRRKLPKKKLPTQANDPSPNVLVLAGETECDGQVVSTSFLLKNGGPARFNMAHVPHALAWQFITPAGDRYFLFCWVNWLRNSAALFQEFCRESGRKFGTVTREGMVDLGTQSLRLRDCKLIHMDELVRSAPKTSKMTVDVNSMAEKFLKGRKDSLEEIEVHSFDDEADAHDQTIQEKVKRSFEKKIRQHIKDLTATYGPPTELGDDQYKLIPVNGVFRFACWQIGKKLLFIVASHEDTELPYAISIGVTRK